MSLVSHDSAEKNIVSFISKIAVCWHFTAAVLKSLASADELGALALRILDLNLSSMFWAGSSLRMGWTRLVLSYRGFAWSWTQGTLNIDFPATNLMQPSPKYFVILFLAASSPLLVLRRNTCLESFICSCFLK